MSLIPSKMSALDISGLCEMLGPSSRFHDAGRLVPCNASLLIVVVDKLAGTNSATGAAQCRHVEVQQIEHAPLFRKASRRQPVSCATASAPATPAWDRVWTHAECALPTKFKSRRTLGAATPTGSYTALTHIIYLHYESHDPRGQSAESHMEICQLDAGWLWGWGCCALLDVLNSAFAWPHAEMDVCLPRAWPHGKVQGSAGSRQLGTPEGSGASIGCRDVLRQVLRPSFPSSSHARALKAKSTTKKHRRPPHPYRRKPLPLQRQHHRCTDNTFLDKSWLRIWLWRKRRCTLSAEVAKLLGFQGFSLSMKVPSCLLLPGTEISGRHPSPL